jgi:ABC-2 type transport system ATP-binding protein
MQAQGVMTALEAADLSKSYGQTVAIERLTFSVDQGHVLGVLGPNGAGKTTAIRMLTTILPPTSGRFAVAGVPGGRPTEIRRRIGVLPESAGYPDLQTGEEFLTFHARLHGRPRAEARQTASRLLAEVGLAERGMSLIRTYSRGMRQRLGIARALVNDPSVVFLDEPTLGLDPAGQRDVLDLIRRITGERGATVLLSTHLLAEVEEVCTDVIILNRGRMVARGRVDEIVRHAAAPRTARIRVSPDLVPRALAVLIAHRDVQRADVPPNAAAGELTMTVAGGDDPERRAAAALSALLDAGVSVLSFTLEGGRLSDAFLAMTEGA